MDPILKKLEASWTDASREMDLAFDQPATLDTLSEIYLAGVRLMNAQWAMNTRDSIDHSLAKTALDSIR